MTLSQAIHASDHFAPAVLWPIKNKGTGDCGPKQEDCSTRDASIMPESLLKNKIIILCSAVIGEFIDVPQEV
jgi:hypothetical protein